MKSIPGSLRYKKRFLRWFLDTKLAVDSEITWFIEDLLIDEQALDRLRFIDRVNASPKGIVISTLPGDEPFIFFKGHVQSDNVYTAYHELQLHDDELFYVQIKFPDMAKSRLYQLLLREERTVMRKNKAIATHLLEHLMHTEKKALIMQKIDWALDTKNEEMFHHYVEQLRELEHGQ